MVEKGKEKGEAVTRRDLLKVSSAALVGTTIEWYDFVVAASAAAVVWPYVFFPEENPAAALVSSLITYSIGFFVRPVGALLFGHFADKYGRKSVLILTLLTMGAGTLGIGLTPSYAAIGILGAVLVALFRLLQGLGLGGEWGAASTFVTEFAAKNRFRAFFGRVGYN
ncbi:hypothetical protein SUSAZ_05400 [Sulfolobus acidocaldarius SUSAZ]|nr:hypothetical protein SUSAZ_05400 [Sulfolobus acidocaldarius SUSAZ]